MESFFSQEHFRSLPKESLQEVYENKRVELPFIPKDLAFFVDTTHGNLQLRVLPYHHRSADLGISLPIVERGKRENRVYCQVDVKGGGFLFPKSFESKKDGIVMGQLDDAEEVYFMPDSKETPWSYDFLGLMDERLAMRVTEVIEMLAETGMRTEALAGVYRTDRVVINGQDVSIDDLKEKVVDQLQQAISAANSDHEKSELEGKIEDLKENFDPVIVIRLMRSVLRIRDMKEVMGDIGQEGVVQMISEACKNLNIEAKALGHSDRFDASTPEGREKWVKFVCFWYGKNAGIMHREGVVHQFLHMGNLTLAGEVVDMDSVGQLLTHKKFRGRPENKEKWIKRGDRNGDGTPFSERSFFRSTDDGCVFISPEVGLHQQPDERFGLPKALLKDLRDSCFSIHLMCKNILTKLPGMNVSELRQKLADDFVRGYKDGLDGSEPFDKIGITGDRLISVCTEISESVIARGEYYAPIPID
ncbi:hypothetical protein A2480_03250 [Candidatus Uhrbacteria bacterium RIFOXYC2_FULL_47_19]|uniref:Uncharacterized protein n=1 Tax=Candidatus Uhrbacteria bacterium RIFOXYC2_FULL_47_19 TaxID=1802424 RepID=A0A1F7WDX3_9BACT|nr:MAG: hypothetical protein A2480_03250 [Candidatus Uhrbacteria bacterium RIFOXYC2_FULL_47_19]